MPHQLMHVMRHTRTFQNAELCSVWDTTTCCQGMARDGPWDSHQIVLYQASARRCPLPAFVLAWLSISPASKQRLLPLSATL